jgi:glutamate-1-semialdehyde 2,1-aminomutase
MESAIAAANLDGVTVDGIDPMWMLRFDRPEREQRFLELCADNGVLLKRGAYNYAALAHDDEAIRDLEAGVSGACVALRDEEGEA